MNQKLKYEVFIKGETVDLVIPNEYAIDEDGWHSWFNDPVTTRYLKYGAVPNTRDKQLEHLQKITAKMNEMLILLVLPKNKDRVVGVTHIGGIDYKSRSGHFGLVMGTRNRAVGDIFQSLETKARMVEHAFEVMGLERIWGAQVVDLEVWQRYQLLLGFKPEGVTRKSFRKGHKAYDEVITSCLLEDYLMLKEARNGQYWPGRLKTAELIKKIPNESIVDQVADSIRTAVGQYIEKIDLY
ncbi:GNAT family N-acetyltransferase [Thermodesulfobacteriota bacterium]